MADVLSPKQRSALERAIKHPELQLILFRKADGLVWLNAFEEAEFLLPNLVPQPKEVEKGQFQIPSWPVTEYLVGIAKYLQDSEHLVSAQKVWNIIKEATFFARDKDYGNYRVWWQFSKIIRVLPVNVVKDDYFNVISYWITDKYERGLVGEQIFSWLTELLDSEEKLSLEIATTLLEIIYAVEIVSKEYSSGDIKEAVFSFQSYQMRKHSQSVASKAGQLLEEKAVDFFIEKMEEVLKIEGSDKWSVMWRRAIEDHEQNHGLESADNIILEALRDSMLGYLSVSDDEPANNMLRNVLVSEFKTIQRVAIYAASQIFKKLSAETIDTLLNTSFLKDHYRHEIWHFLNKNFNEFSESSKELVLHNIEKNIIRLNDDGSTNEAQTNYQQSIWLSSIKDFHTEANKRYIRCVEVTGVEPDHPDFSSYTTSGLVTHESPFSVEDLAGMSQDLDKMVAFLNGYTYQGHFKEPGLEGLVNTFKSFVSSDKNFVLDNSDSFLELKPYYLHELINSFSESWEEKDDLEWDMAWPKLLEFAHRLVTGDLFWNYPDEAPGGAFVGTTNWVVGTLCRLIEAGCKKDERSFSLDNVQMAKNVLEKILHFQVGEEFKEDSDAVSVAINSPRGRCLEAYINLALFHMRNSPEDERLKISKGYMQVFDAELLKADQDIPEYEFATLVANYFPNFLYISNDWAKQNIHKIFDKNNKQRWLCAVQGFSYVGQFIPEVYDHFKENGDFIAILESDQLRERVDDRYIQFLVIAYYRKVESIEDESSLLAKVLKREMYRELGQMIWFIWTLKSPDDEDRVKEMSFELFPRLLEIIDLNSKEGRKLASRLCFWTGYITDLSGEQKEWLMEIAPYAQEDYNANYLLEGLADLSGSYPFEAAEVWMEMLKSYAYDYPEEALKQIYKNLVIQGIRGKRKAKDIAGKYLQFELTRPGEWLEEVIAEIANV